MRKLIALLTLSTALSIPAMVTMAEPQYEWKTYSMFGVSDAYQQLTEVGGSAVKGERVWKQVPITIVTKDVDTGLTLGSEVRNYSFTSEARGGDIGKTDITVNGLRYRYYNEDVVTVIRPATVIRRVQRMDYTLHFSLNGGSGDTPADMNLSYGQYVHLPPINPTREGFTFDGWTTFPDGNKTLEPEQEVIDVRPRGSTDRDVTLYVHWVPEKVTIHFGEGIQDIQLDYMGYFGRLPIPVQTGKEFKGWSIGGQLINENTRVASRGYMELQPVWQDKNYTITFVDGSQTTSIQAPAGSQFNTPSPIGTNTFKWWAQDGTTSEYSARVASKDLTLVAVYDVPQVRIATDGGDIFREQGGRMGTVAPLERTGHKFEGWFWDQAFTQPVRQTDPVPPENTRIYAKVTPTRFRISFEGRGDSVEIGYGEPVPMLPSGAWLFQGKFVTPGMPYTWNTSIRLTPVLTATKVVTFPNGQTAMRGFGDTVGDLPPIPQGGGRVALGYVDQYGNQVTSATRVFENLRISYQYVKSTITLTVHHLDGTTSSSSQMSGEVVRGLPQQSKPGYTFLGYSTHQDSVTAETVFYESADVYPIFAAETSEVTFSDGVTPRTMRTGDALGQLPTPTKAGYVFDGWMYNGNLVSSSTQVTPGGMHLEARWELIQVDTSATVTVYFKVDGVVINVIDLHKGDVLADVGEPPVTHIGNRAFNGWYKEDGTRYQFGRPVTDNLTLIGRFINGN